MHIIVNYIIGVLIACGLFWAGRYFLAHPDKVVRLFVRKEERPDKSSIAFARFVGNFLIILGVLGAALYIFLLAGHLMGRHG